MSQSSFQNAAQTTYVNSIRMLLQSGNVVVVEGKSDQSIYQSYFQSIVFAAGCKSNLNKAIKTLKSKHQRKHCRAIPDRDYDFFLHKNIESELYVYTDAHSLETMLWKTEDGTLLEKVLHRFFRDDETVAIEVLKQCQEVVFRTAYRLGLCRLVNEKHTWMINQQETLTPSMFDSKSGELLIDRYLMEILQKADRSDLYQFYLDEVNADLQKDYDRWEIIHGHDISRVFYYYIRQYCIQNHCSLNKRSTKDFEKMTRSLVACCRLQDSHMIRNVQKWEAELEA